MTDARNAIHVALVAVMVWLSFVFQMPGDTFASPAFAEFERIGTEGQWAYWFLAIAFVGIVGIVAAQKWVRLLSVFVLASAHGTIALCFYMGTPHGQPVSTGTGTYGIIAGLGYYLLSRRWFA